MAVYTGSCECRSIRVRFETARPLADLPVLGCKCGFCRRHTARLTADPAGRLEIKGDLRALQRYKFAHKVSEFILCRICGSYVGNFAQIGGQGLGAVSVMCLDDWEGLIAEPRFMPFNGVEADQKLGWRQKLWTPATVSI
jgi:hypothetical protein